MAIATDFSVAVNGDIRYTGTTDNYTVLELHRFLQDLADDAVASGNDLVDITSDTPSERSTDNIITLLGAYNIDDDAAEHLYGGSITQADGDVVYSGLRVLGAVNDTGTQLMVIQDNDIYQFTTTPAAPFWGPQNLRLSVTYNTLAGGTFSVGDTITFSGTSTGTVYYDNGSTNMILFLTDGDDIPASAETFNNGGGVSATVNGTPVSLSFGYNGSAAAGVLMRCLIKSRVGGADIDGKRIRVQARQWGDTYDFFNVTLGQGESVAAISTTPDAQNDTAQATVTAYTHVTNSGSIPVDAQDETSFDNSPTSEGTFSGGTGYGAGDVILLSDGSTVTVDNETATVVDQFTISSSTSRGAIATDTLSQVSVTPAGGTGFSVTLDTDNVVIDPDNPRGGFQGIDLNNGNGSRDYYSQWTFGADTSGDGLKGIWEFIKDLSGNGTTKTIDALNGELFLGVTHSFAYDNEASGPFEEHETLVWGTDITYDTLSGGPFTVGEYVTIGALGAAGKVLYDNGSTNMIVALENTTITLSDGETITGLTSGATADINTTILNNDKAGGQGLLLALDDQGATGTLYIQLLTGSAPVDNLPVRGLASSATADVQGTPVPKTVPKIFLGSYTGTLIGAYGVGADPDDLTASDTIQDLAGVTQTPPNNVTFSVTGLVSGEDRVLVGPRTGSVLNKAQDTLNTTLNGASETAVVVNTAIPSDTPAIGDIRVQLDTGIYREQPYLSYTASTYTIASADYQSANAATSGNNVFIAYIDELATGATASFTTVYSSPRNLFVRVRDGGNTPIKTFEAPATLGSAGGSIAAIRTDDF